MPKFVKFKTKKFWNAPGESHYLTFSTVDKIAYLANDEICLFLAASIERAKSKHDFVVLAYVFMPDHVHMILLPLNAEYDMAAISKSIKLSSSKKAKNANIVRDVLWEPGAGYDENFTGAEARVGIIEYIHLNPVRKELVTEPTAFRWSSAKWYHTGEQGDIECHRFHDLES